jgi:hypothetical protein
MFVLTADNKIVEGRELSTEELNAMKYFDEHIHDKCYLTSRETNYIKEFIFTEFDIKVKINDKSNEPTTNNAATSVLDQPESAEG